LPKTEYLGFISVFQLFDSKMKDYTEIYSILRSIPLSKKTFIDRHYDDGTFHSSVIRDSASSLWTNSAQ